MIRRAFVPLLAAGLLLLSAVPQANAGRCCYVTYCCEPWYCPPPCYPPIYVAPAELRVVVPTPDALLRIDGRPTYQTGQVRIFYTPPLEYGKTYTYVMEVTVKGEGKAEDIVLEKKVDVTAGEPVEVIFELPAEAGEPK